MTCKNFGLIRVVNCGYSAVHAFKFVYCYPCKINILCLQSNLNFVLKDGVTPFPAHCDNRYAQESSSFFSHSDKLKLMNGNISLIVCPVTLRRIMPKLLPPRG